MRHIAFLLSVIIALALGAPARSAEFNIPGLERDSQAYVEQLSAKFPAGASPQVRRQSDQAVDAALRKQDWAATAAALETRVGQGEVLATHWIALARAQLRRTPPDPRRALQAAWLAFTASDAGADEVPPLLLMADALRRLDRPVQVIQALEAAIERTPDDPNLTRQLADARRAAGVLVSRIRTEPEAEPPRACLEFTVAPVKRDDFQPQDWVQLNPPVPGAATTREGDQLCVSGLPSGATTRLTLRAGMPGEGGLSVVRDLTYQVAMANKRARIDFDTRMFVLPRGQTPALGMTTVNLSAVKLTLARLTERNVVAFIRDSRLGQPVETWNAAEIGERTGSVVWTGTAQVPKWEPNKPARVALPLPDALASAGPGLYALSVQAGDGTPNTNGAVQMILRTDLAPTVWRGADGLTIQVRGFADVLPRPGVTLRLLADNNDVLAETTTDALGVGRFAKPLLRGEGPLAPRAVHAFGPDSDFTMLDLENAAFDLSDRGVAGLPHPGPLDAYVWLDRGIYRPGETVQVMALLRDDAGRPADMPAHIIVKRPNGQVFLDSIVARLAEASTHLPVVLSAGAPAGTWTVEVKADPTAPPIGTASFRVDAFVPDRMAVVFGAVPGPLRADAAYTLPITANFLYGAPAAGLTGHASLRLVVDPAPFLALSGYRIGMDGEIYAPDQTDIDLPATDAQGKTVLTIPARRAPDTTFALKAAIEAVVDDPAGRGSRAALEIPVRSAGNLLGIKPGFAGNAVDAGTEAAFDIAAVNQDGIRISVKAKLRLVRERPDWRLVTRGGLARYETVWRDEPLQTTDIVIPADAPFHVARKFDFGRYRIEITEAGGMAGTSMRFRSGWVSSDSPDMPDLVDVSADRKAYAPGDTARIHIAPPFGGQASLLVVTDKVHTIRTVEVAAGGTDVDVPVDAAWGPGAYIAVHLYRTAADAKSRPGRAIGLVWAGIDPATRTLPVAFEAAEKYNPRARAAIRLRTAPGAWVSLAAVDEGILRLTNFVSPDPRDHFLGRRRLGLDIRDDWGRLIAPPDGEATSLRQGGDDGAFTLPDIPQKTVTLFIAPVQAGADGIAEFPLDLPDFNGQVRLMAVAWSGTKIGAASKPITVRDPVVAEPLLPRFLAPGDQARLTVLLHNLDLPAGETVVELSVDGPLSLSGPSRLAATLAPGAQALPSTVLAATGAGRGIVRLNVTGPAGFTVQRETAITIRPARGATTIVAGGDIAPGAEASLAPPADRFLAGTWRASATLGGAVRYDVAGLVASLERYPLNCLEQATSRGFPLALLPDGPIAGPDRVGRLQRSVELVLDRQRYDGGFGLWYAGNEAEPWLSVYATEFLIRARQAGAAIPEPAMVDALKFIGEAADGYVSSPEEFATQAYRLYVLALAGTGRPGAARVMAEQIGKLPTPLAKAQLGAALAMGRDTRRAEAAFEAALAGSERRWWHVDYGSALRDQAAIAILLKESGVAAARLTALIQAMPGANLSPDTLNTQEQAWAAAAGAVLGQGLRPVRVSVGGRDLPPAPVQAVALTGPVSVRNLGDQAVLRTVSATGVPVTALAAARAGMRLGRQFMTMDGQPLDLDKLRQNTIFVLVLEGRAEDGQPHRAMVQHGLPAGWEIAGRFGAGDAPGLSWLTGLSEVEAQPAADDRYAAVVALTAEKPAFKLAIRVRAVTPGTYELPGAEVADMYRPGVFARQNAGRITVQALE